MGRARQRQVISVPGQECRDLRGYGASRRTSVDPIIGDTLPTRDGSYALCIIGGPDARWTDAWPSIRFPTVVRDYRPSFIPFITLPRRDAPYTFCAIPYDSALNEGAVIDRLLL